MTLRPPLYSDLPGRLVGLPRHVAELRVVVDRHRVGILACDDRLEHARQPVASKDLSKVWPVGEDPLDAAVRPGVTGRAAKSGPCPQGEEREERMLLCRCVFSGTR